MQLFRHGHRFVILPASHQWLLSIKFKIFTIIFLKNLFKIPTLVLSILVQMYSESKTQLHGLVKKNKFERWRCRSATPCQGDNYTFQSSNTALINT